jgi:hypothetical protein
LDTFSRLQRKRGSGRVIGFIADPEDGDVFFHAKRHGLIGNRSGYSAVSAAEAVRIIATALQADFAYRHKLRSEAQAARMAADVFDQVFAGCSTFYSNGSLGLGGSQWSPATEATFDTGVLGVGPERCSCVWFLDED